MESAPGAMVEFYDCRLQGRGGLPGAMRRWVDQEKVQAHRSGGEPYTRILLFRLKRIIPVPLRFLGLIIPLAIIGGCLKPRNLRNTRGELATVVVRELGESSYDSMRLRLFAEADRQLPLVKQETLRGRGAIEAKVPVGRYELQIDYLLDGKLVLSSIACDESQIFEMKAGLNEIALSVCDANGQKYPPDKERCVPGKPAYGIRTLRLFTSSEYQRTIQDLVGIDKDLTQDFPKEVRTRGMENVTEKSVITEAHASSLIKAAAAIGTKIVGNVQQFTSCKSGESEEDCARHFLESFGRRAFRGPLDNGEIDRLMNVYRDGRKLRGNFAGGIALTVEAMLVSPRFLYRFEIGERRGNYYELTSWELAQALSYTYWGSMPDNRLLDLADRNELIKPAVLRDEALRLLDSPRSRPILGDFAARWLGADSVLGVNKDTGRFPQFTSSLREKFLKETKDLFNDVVLDKSASFESLFTADYTLGDDEIASHYGGQKQGLIVRLPPKERMGILGHASILASFSDAEDTAPIKRGLMALERVFCQTIPSPPPSLNVVPPPRNPQATTRERFSTHSNSDACAICHIRIDGAGFGFEDMDPIGRFRSLDAGRPVDAAGVLVSQDGQRSSFRGTLELSRIAAKSPDAQRCFVKQAQRFVTGRHENASDSCTIQALESDFAGQEFNLKKLFLSLPLHESFTKRRP